MISKMLANKNTWIVSKALRKQFSFSLSLSKPTSTLKKWIESTTRQFRCRTINGKHKKCNIMRFFSSYRKKNTKRTRKLNRGNLPSKLISSRHRRSHHMSSNRRSMLIDRTNNDIKKTWIDRDSSGIQWWRMETCRMLRNAWINKTCIRTKLTIKHSTLPYQVLNHSNCSKEIAQ